MRLFTILFIAAVLTASIGCTRKSSSDSGRKPDTTLANLNAAPQQSPAEEAASASPDGSATGTPSAADAPSVADAPASAAASPAPSDPSPRMPAFMDASKGAIVDLPQYPNSMRTNVQYGALRGAGDSALILATTSEPIEKVRAFYEKVIRGHNWTVTSQITEPENYKWNLKKGDRDEGLVQIRKDPGARGLTIILSRLEKPPPKKAASR